MMSMSAANCRTARCGPGSARDISGARRQPAASVDDLVVGESWASALATAWRCSMSGSSCLSALVRRRGAAQVGEVDLAHDIGGDHGRWSGSPQYSPASLDPGGRQRESGSDDGIIQIAFNLVTGF